MADTENEERQQALAELEQTVRNIAADPNTSLTEVVQALAAFMSQTELDNLRRWITTDALPKVKQREAVGEALAEERAHTIETVRETMSEEDLQVETDEQGSRPWKPWHPTNPSTWFFYGDLATDQHGKVWQSMVGDDSEQGKKIPNVWEPGAPGIDARYWMEWTEPEVVEIPEDEAPTAPVGSADNPLPFMAGVAVTAGQYVTHNNVVYKVVQGHTLADHWPPASVPSLFQPA